MTDAMTRVAPPPAAMAGTTTKDDRAAWGIVALLVGAPVLRMLGVIIHPLDTEDALETLAHVDAVAPRWALAHLVEPASMLLLAAAGFLVARLAPAAGRRTARAGAALWAMGCSGLALLVYGHGEAYLNMAHESVDQSQMVALYERFHEGVPLAAPLIPLFSLGAVLLGVGLHLARAVPLPAIVAFVVATVLPNAIPSEDSLIPAAIIGSIPMIFAMAVFARALVRQHAEPAR